MNKLPSESIRLLSSSQVITSPSSVVKELVENAFDAGATTLDVKLEKFGLEKIEVRDNGCGIKESDTEFMAQQYYTSKISKHEDLQMLETYGFRGEALGSLCQVADVCIVTRTVKDPVAVLYHLDHNGKICSTKPTHDGVGTTVITSNLFKNFPVRKQCFQTTKKGKEELKKIEELLMAYGLINPEVRIILRNNKNVIWQKNKCCDIRTALTDVFGVQLVNQFEYFEYCDNDLHLTVQCFVPKTDSDPLLMWRSSDERSFIFVNKRYVIWKELSQVLKKRCVLKNKETSSGKYPLCLVSVCLSSQDVDANLEPNKTKVIINHKEEVLEIITKELCKIYNANDLLPVNEKTHCMESTGIQSITTIASAGERAHLDQTCELRAQKTSEVVTNQSTSTTSLENERPSDIERPERSASAVEMVVNADCIAQNERPSDIERSERSASAVEMVVNADCIAQNERPSDIERSERSASAVEMVVNADRIAQNESFHQQGNTDDHKLSNSNISSEATTNCSFPEENNVVDVLQENDNLITRKDSSVDSNITSDPVCMEKRNDNNDGIAATSEKQDGLQKSSDLDELLENFINDSDIIDDSLLDISLETVAPNQEQWSKGQGLIDKSGKEIEPLQLLRPSVCNKENENSTGTSLSNGKRKNIGDKDISKSDRPSKRNKKHSMVRDCNITNMISGQSLLKSVLQSPKTSCNADTSRKRKEVSFSLSRLKQLAAYDKPSALTTTKEEDIQLIKRLDPWGVWLVHQKRKLFILNPYRIQELLLYKRLLSTHVVPTEKLDKAISLDERVLGGSSRFSLLKKLVIQNNQDEKVRCCDDERLVSNGFEITGRLDRENGEISISLVKMNTTIPYFGIGDLIEVLDFIKDNESRPENGKKNRDLASYRTNKVSTFLKDEVARISRSLPSRMSDTDIAELLKNMNEHLTENESTCVHNRPLLHSLVSF